MSIWKNGKLVAGGRQTTPLLSFMWADHILDDISWLRADTFSWQSGAVYQAVYQHLAADIDGKTPQSETIGATTIWFYLADDGHKIVPVNNANLVEDIYNATGVAWYYILDTVNQRFKLPRTKFGFTGLRDNVGKYVAAGLPDHTHKIKFRKNDSTGHHANGNIIPHLWTSGYTYQGDTDAAKNASESNSIYGASDTVQPKATQMYLYFYVGQFTQTALENAAGITAETLNDKVDKGHQVIEFQVPTADNNYTWYRKYADGWVEQGGRASGDRTVYLPVIMSDANYTLVITKNDGDSGTQAYGTSSITSSSFYANRYTSGLGLFSWQVSGMAAA